MQVAIDNAKRRFDIDLNEEITRIKKDMDIEINKRPLFFVKILESNARKRMSQSEKQRKQTKEERAAVSKKSSEKTNADLKCPMNYLHSVKFGGHRSSEPTIPMDRFFVKYELEESRRKSKKVEELIEKYSINLYNSVINDEDDYLLLNEEFDKLIEDIKNVYISKTYIGLMSWLVDRAFGISNGVKNNKVVNSSCTYQNKSLLLKVLYNINSECLLKVLSKNISHQKSAENG